MISQTSTCDVLGNDLENIQGLSIDLSKSGKRKKRSFVEMFKKPKFLNVVYFNCKSFKRCKWSKNSFVRATCSIKPHNTQFIKKKESNC